MKNNFKIFIVCLIINNIILSSEQELTKEERETYTQEYCNRFIRYANYNILRMQYDVWDSDCLVKRNSPLGTEKRNNCIKRLQKIMAIANKCQKNDPRKPLFPSFSPIGKTKQNAQNLINRYAQKNNECAQINAYAQAEEAKYRSRTSLFTKLFFK